MGARVSAGGFFSGAARLLHRHYRDAIDHGMALECRQAGLPSDIQVAPGVYLSLYILGHMNSVFIYARNFLGIPTDWNFAIGAPTGLIHEAWNIHLLPHYALGVFFVLSHLASGLRMVLIAHGVDRLAANRLWGACVAISAFISAAIIAGMCGVRIATAAACSDWSRARAGHRCRCSWWSWTLWLCEFEP